jgi:hypothetical protein
LTFIHFTGPDGHTVSLAPAQIVDLREPLPHEMSPTTKTVIVTLSGFQAVRESMAEIEAKLARV